MQIEIDFDVYKALTLRRESETHTYNDVLRDILGLDSIMEPDRIASPLDDVADALSRPIGVPGFYSRGLFLPDGTQLRARYKQKVYRALVAGDRWLDEQKRQHSSASAAAAAITGTNVNGLRFWEAKRPSDTSWNRLELLRTP